MKNQIILMLFLFLFSSFGKAQECGEEFDEFGEIDECEDNIFNIRIDTFSFLAQSILIGFDYGITDNFSLGIDLGYIHDTDLTEGIEGKSNSGTLRLAFYLDSILTDSLISLAGWRVADVKLRDKDRKKDEAIIENSLTTTAFVRSGFRWLWTESGVNVLMTAGISYIRVDSVYLTNSVKPEVELSFGYQF